MGPIDASKFMVGYVTKVPERAKAALQTFAAPRTALDLEIQGLY